MVFQGSAARLEGHPHVVARVAVGNGKDIKVVRNGLVLAERHLTLTQHVGKSEAIEFSYMLNYLVFHKSLQK